MKFIDRLLKIQTYTAIGIIFMLCGYCYEKYSYKNDWHGKLSFNESDNYSENSKIEVKNKLNKMYLRNFIEVSFPNENDGR